MTLDDHLKWSPDWMRCAGCGTYRLCDEERRLCSSCLHHLSYEVRDEEERRRRNGEGE